MIGSSWKSTKPQVRSGFRGWAWLVGWGCFRFWCCQSVAAVGTVDLPEVIASTRELHPREVVRALVDSALEDTGH